MQYKTVHFQQCAVSFFLLFLPMQTLPVDIHTAREYTVGKVYIFL